MRAIFVLGFIAIGSIIPAPQAIAQVTCDTGKAPITIITPSGKIRTMCVPNSAVPGIENAADNAPGTISPAQCPCFTEGEVATAISAGGGVYNFNTYTFADGSGNVCSGASVDAIGNFGFYGMTKQAAPTEGCLTTDFYPIVDIQPNGCFKQIGNNAPVLLSNIQPEESSVCVAILGKFAQ